MIALPATPAGIEALIPHKGTMSLWDQVLAWDADRIVLRTARHRAADHPLRSDDMLRAVHLCEYGAQAMAVHGGLLAAMQAAEQAPGQAPRIRAGQLVALRAVHLHVRRVDDLAGPLEGQANLVTGNATAHQYAFRITHAHTLLAEGRATVMLTEMPA